MDKESIGIQTTKKTKKGKTAEKMDDGITETMINRALAEEDMRDAGCGLGCRNPVMTIIGRMIPNCHKTFSRN